MITTKTQRQTGLEAPRTRRARSAPRSFRAWAIAGLVLALLLVGTVAAVFILASYPLIRGYANHSYIPDGQYSEGVDVALEPTDKAAESKLWHHDGTWWGVMWNPQAGEYHIYELIINSQEWVDTGVFVDNRLDSRADVLWDAANNRLYIATHRKQENPSNENTNPMNWAYLQQYSYNNGNDTWVPIDNGIADGSGVITNHITESIVLDQDTEGHLWATYTVRRNPGGAAHYYVAISSSQQNNPAQWTTPVVWDSLPGNVGEVDLDDIASVIAFDDGTPQMGVLWSNQRTGEFYFASRSDTDPVLDWTIDSEFEAMKSSAGVISADDHINIKTTPAGDILAIVKTSASEDPGAEPTLVGIFARKASTGDWSWHPVSPSDSFDTRPLVLYNESNDTVYAYTVSSTGGGSVCYQTAELGDVSSMVFPPGGCDPSDPFSSEVLFISHYAGGFENITNPTSTKQIIDDDTGMVVLASDDVNGFIYVHNMEGGGAPVQPPAATATPRPGGEETDAYLPFFAN